jgi:hypothetical protein
MLRMGEDGEEKRRCFAPLRFFSSRSFFLVLGLTFVICNWNHIGVEAVNGLTWFDVRKRKRTVA